MGIKMRCCCSALSLFSCIRPPFLPSCRCSTIIPISYSHRENTRDQREGCISLHRRKSECYGEILALMLHSWAWRHISSCHPLVLRESHICLMEKFQNIILFLIRTTWPQMICYYEWLLTHSEMQNKYAGRVITENAVKIRRIRTTSTKLFVSP